MQIVRITSVLLGLAVSPAGIQAAENVSAVPGFEVELLYRVPQDEQGSWVAIAKDPEGRLIVSDQGGAGLFRVTVDDAGKEPRVDVQKIPVKVSGAQGLVWAFDSLYAHVNGRHLVRIRDTDGDDQLDAVEELPGPTGGGEHGNHAVILTEDRQALYVLAGNHTRLPDLARSRLPSWDEDFLLTRMWDARGHARGVLAPGGWVCRFEPNAKTYELYCSGFRNCYDIALNRHGDLFTFDADMEWDMGAPWYRPTRICHVVSGGEFGWRSGTAKWPVYFEDSLPPVVDVGPGSPTGMVAGLGAKFPAKYQRAIFALDWTFGTIYAVHLEEQGASYTGRAEHFVWGKPLPVTDAVIGDDGAMYFTVGGRGTQSALYRVTWTGENEQPVATNAPSDPAAAQARAQRRRLETFHGRQDAAAVAAAWPYLANSDRFLRYAARVAIESQPVEQWASRVVSEPDAQARITAAVALARMGQSEHQSPLIASLLEVDPNNLSDAQFLGLLRAYALTFIRLGPPSAEERQQVIAALDPHLPNENDDVNTELVRVLVYLRAPGIVEKTMALIENRRPPATPDWLELISRNDDYGGTISAMLDNRPPEREIGYALMLRNLRHGWTQDQRRAYFQFLNEAAQASGGASYHGFLTNIRSDALENASSEERLAVKDVTGEDFNPVPDFEIKPIEGPGQKWTMDDLQAITDRERLSAADFERGRSLYFAAECGKCHRFAGLGGGVGPDLSSVRNKFDARYLLESLIEPSKVISDQYASSVVVLDDGRVLTGLAVEEGDSIVVYPPDPNAKPTSVPRENVDEVAVSATSQMPDGLLDRLNQDEIRDLLAYLLSSGNRDDAVYRKP